jgi:hypothetical protein
MSVIDVRDFLNARLRLGFSPGLMRGRNLGVDLIHGKLVHSGFLGAGP